jgi:hypothetical protein
MLLKRGYGCLYLDPSRLTIQCAEVPLLSLPARSVTNACWPAKDHHSKVRPCGQICSNGTTSIPHHLREVTTNRTKVGCPVSYLFATSMGIIGVEDKHKRKKAEYFALV